MSNTTSVATRVCAVEGCGRRPHARGWCKTHYEKMWRRSVSSDRLCGLAGCSSPHLARGFCKLHYLRWKSWGDPLHVGSRYGQVDVDALALERFWSKVDRSGECWIWVGSKYRNGSGVFTIRSARFLAHRWIYEKMVGLIGEGLDLRHTCGESSCVRPDHLEPTTRRDNVLASRITEFSRRAPSCKHGHAFTPENTRLLPSGRRKCRSCERDAEYRWRRKRLGFPAVDPIARVDRLAVFQRDSWCCGICSRPVDRSLRFPDPMSVSLDHVVPLACGGNHSWDNVQAAHLVCNLKKGARWLTTSRSEEPTSSSSYRRP